MLKHKENYKVIEEPTVKPPRSRSKMKKSASVSHSRTSLCKSLSHDGAPVSTANDDCAINELLEGLMDLNVYLPDGRRVRMTVERRTPMMDLLVQVTTANKITPGDHVIQVLTDSGKEILYRPNTPIGVLDTHVIFIASKSSVTEPAVKKLHKMPVQPFEQTFRLQVKLPRNQLTVLRVSPKMTLTEVKDKICSDKNLDANDYHLVRPSQPNIFLDLNTSLASYGSTEISLLSKQSIKANIHSSVADLLNYSRREDDGKEKGIPGLLTKTQSQSSLVSSSSENVSSRKDPQNFGNYQIDQVRTALTIKPKLRKRPAPPPPTQKTKNSMEEVDKLRLSSQIRNGDKFLHSRRSSDSSGYHEASVVSEIQENGFPDPSVAKRNSRCESNVIPVQLFPQEEIHTTEKTCMSSKNVECQSTISNSGSISSTSSMLTVSKKRKAPPPPAPKRCISKPQLEPVREVIASNKTTDGESKSLLHVNQETLESEFTGLVDIVEANLSLDQEEVLSCDPVTVSVPSKDSDDLSSIQPNPPHECANGSNERIIENSQNTSEVELLTVQDTPEPRVHGSELVIESVFSKESDDLSSIQPNPPHECVNGSNERTIEDSQNTSEVGSTSSREQIMTDGQHQRQNSLSSINTLDDIENTFRQTIAEGERALKWEQEKEECRSFLPTGIANGTSNKTLNAQFDSDLTHNGHLSHIDTDFSAVEQQVNDMTINEPLSSSNCLPEEPLSFKGRKNGVNSHLQQNEDKKKSSSEVCIKTNGLTSQFDDGMSVNTEEEVVNVKLKRGTSLTNFIITSYKNGEANIYRPNSRMQTELLLRSDNVCHLSNESLSAAQKPSEYKKENLETKPSSQMFVKEQNENPPKFQNLNVNGEEDQIEVTSKAQAACIKEAYVQDFRGHVRLKCAQFNDLKCLPLVGRSTSMLNLVNHRQSFLQKKKHDGVLETLRRVQSQHSVSNKSCDPEFSDEDQELQEKYKQPKKNFFGWQQKVAENQKIFQNGEITTNVCISYLEKNPLLTESTRASIKDRFKAKSQNLSKVKSLPRVSMIETKTRQVSSEKDHQRLKSHMLANVTIGSWQQRSFQEDPSWPKFHSVENLVSQHIDQEATITNENCRALHSNKSNCSSKQPEVKPKLNISVINQTEKPQPNLTMSNDLLTWKQKQNTEEGHKRILTKQTSFEEPTIIKLNMNTHKPRATYSYFGAPVLKGFSNEVVQNLLKETSELKNVSDSEKCKYSGIKTETNKTVTELKTENKPLNLTNILPPPVPPVCTTAEFLSSTKKSTKKTVSDISDIDPRDQLLIDIRNFQGRSGLRKVPVAETNWQLNIFGPTFSSSLHK